uniref:hypothetical protein n=1 Tax=Streptococcus canis TaxID=1329 RepID=UPI00242BF644|nr:hypothetical protein [Streptococcus canis]
MTNKELAQYLLQSLNMGLGAIMQGETNYTNSFNIMVQEDGFIFVPRLPCAYILDDELYNKIFLIANASLYPHYTLLKQNATYFVPLKTDDIHVQRGLLFPWKVGISKRLVIPDLDPEGIVIPIGHGTGLIQVIDNEHPYQVLPLLCPTYYTKKGIL